MYNITFQPTYIANTHADLSLADNIMGSMEVFIVISIWHGVKKEYALLRDVIVICCANDNFDVVFFSAKFVIGGSATKCYFQWE